MDFMANLEKQLNDIRSQHDAFLRQQAEQRRIDAVDDALRDLPFPGTKDRNEFRRFVASQVKAGGSGSFETDDGESLGTFVQRQYSARRYFPPVATDLPAATPVSGAKGFDLSRIQPGMSVQDKEEARKAILANLPK